MSNSMEVDGGFPTSSNTTQSMSSITPNTVRGMDLMADIHSSGSHGTDMVDSTTTSGSSMMKRSNSAPMINMLVTSGIRCNVTTSISTTFPDIQMRDRSKTVSHSSAMDISHHAPTELTHPLAHHSIFPQHTDLSHRIRRFSTSSSSGLHSPSSLRLNQLKYEEQESREIAHERETQSTMQIQYSCEEWRIDDGEHRQRSKSVGEQLHVFTSPYSMSSSPSPTRVGKQRFSPALQQPVLGASPSPSPKSTLVSRRSQSPITLRPSPLLHGVKRKIETDDSEKMDTHYHSPKRMHYGSSTPDRYTSNPFSNSVSSSSSIDECMGSSLNDQSHLSSLSLPTLSSGCPDSTQTPTHTPAHTPNHTPTHTPSPGPHTAVSSTCFSFRPVRDSVDTTRTDSECSDMTETTDISDTGDVHVMDRHSVTHRHAPTHS